MSDLTASNETVTMIGTMSTLGWVTDPALKLDRIFSYWLASQTSQSYIYAGKIYSFQTIIARYDGDKDRVQNAVVSELTEMLDRHWPGRVSITTDATIVNPSKSMRYHLNIYVSLTLNDKNYDVTKALDVEGTTWSQLNIRD